MYAQSGDFWAMTYTLPCGKQTASGNLLYSCAGGSRLVFCEDSRWVRRGEGGKEAQEKGAVCKHVADSMSYKAETDTTL